MSNSQLYFVVGMTAAAIAAGITYAFYRKRRLVFALSFSRRGPLSIDAGRVEIVTVTSPIAARNDTTVTLRSDSDFVVVPDTVRIAANATTSDPVAIAAQFGGKVRITATADGFQPSTLEVIVRPVLSDLTPASAGRGTTVRLNGSGFTRSARVFFGTQEVTPVTPSISPYELTVRVPNLATSEQGVTVTVNGQTSEPIRFRIMTLLFRTTVDHIETFSFSGTTFTSLHTVLATRQEIQAVVGIAFNGDANVLRTTRNEVQNFNIVNNESLSVAGAVPGHESLTGIGAAIAASRTLVVRAGDGLETYSLIGLSPHRPLVRPGTSAGVAVDLSGDFAVGAHAGGIDVYNVHDVSRDSAPRLMGSASPMRLQPSSAGDGVKFARDARGGLFIVRSGQDGIEVYTIGPYGTPNPAGSLTGPDFARAGAVNTALVIDGTRAVRVHRAGIEVYQLSDDPAHPGVLGILGRGTGGATSETLVDAFIAGDWVFRTTPDVLECYDISSAQDVQSPVMIPARVSTPVTSSGLGLGLCGR